MTPEQNSGLNEPITPSEWEIVAVQLMLEILYCNGGVNRWHPEPKKYPKGHTKRIAKAAELFFGAHPEFLNDEDINQICDGEVTENAEKYGIHPEYNALSEALDKYFNS